MVVAEVPIQCQVANCNQILQRYELFLDHFLDTFQFRGQFYLRFIPVPASFGTTAPSL